MEAGGACRASVFNSLPCAGDLNKVETCLIIVLDCGSKFEFVNDNVPRTECAVSRMWCMYRTAYVIQVLWSLEYLALIIYMSYIYYMLWYEVMKPIIKQCTERCVAIQKLEACAHSPFSRTSTIQHVPQIWTTVDLLQLSSPLQYQVLVLQHPILLVVPVHTCKVWHM